jgi:hypothetical protein
MSGNRIEVELSVEDKGGTINKRTRDTKELNQELSRAADLSRKASAVGAKYQAAQGNANYNSARGAMGATGASARDFAQEAQGLGGLVRVYATVAANLFAVTAAFGALKESANTTTMIASMDQLGAKSGVALGSMAVKFAEATDGAISLREAMSSVTKASSAGLSSKQTIEIAKGAKQASQALGIDMSDAISRLTRGITKLEPELLDELGLYTKLGPAADKYALSIGKTAATLTDYERRQAFAIAVMDELKLKFGEIDQAANPWQKLEASIRNLATVGLALVDKVLGPIASILANNSTLLGAVLAGLAFKLLNMAVPALASWRDQLVKTAATAKKSAADITESFASKNVDSTMARFNLPELQSNLDSAKAKYTKAVSDIAQIQKDQKLRDTKTTKNMTGGVYGEDPKDFVRTQAQINDLSKKNTTEATAYANALQRAKDAKKDELKYTRDINSAHDLAEQQFQKSSMGEAARQRISRRASARSDSLEALANVGPNTEKGGFSFGLAQLEKDINKSASMSGWDKLKTKATGWAVAGATEAGIFLRSLSGVMNVIGLLGAVFGVLDALFSTNAESLGEFNSQVSQSNKTVETATKVMANYGNTISAAGSIAKGNVFGQLTEDISTLSDRLQKTDSLASWFDRMVDDVKQVAGKGLKRDFANTVADNLVAQLKLIPEGPLKAAAEEKLKEVLKVGDLSLVTIRDSVLSTANADVVEFARKGNDALKQYSDRQKQVGLDVAAVAISIKTADDAFMQLGASLAASDPVSKFGIALIQVGIDVTKSFKDVESTVGAVEKLLEKPRVVGLLGPGAFEELNSIKAILPAISANIDNFTTQITQTQTALDALANIDLQDASAASIRAIDEEKLKLKDKLGTLTIMLDSNKLNFKAISEQLNSIVSGAIVKGYGLVERMADAAIKQASIAISKNLLSGLSGPGISEAMGNLNVQDLTIQKEQNSIMTMLNNTMVRANALKERELAEQGIKDINEKARKENRGLNVNEQAQITNFQGTVAGVNLIEKAMDANKSVSKNDMKGMNPVAAGIAANYGVVTQGARATNAALDAKQKIEEDNKELGRLKEIREEDTRIAQTKLRSLDITKQQNDLTLSIYEYLNDSQLKTKQQLDTEIQSQTQLVARKALQDEIGNIVDRESLARKNNDLTTAAAMVRLKNSKQGQLDQLVVQQYAESGILKIQQEQVKIGNEFAKINRIAQDKVAIDQLTRDIGIDRISNELELLGIQSQVYSLDPEQVRTTEQRLKLDLLEKQSLNDKAKVNSDNAAKNRELDEQEKKAKLDLANYDKTYFDDRRTNVENAYNLEIAKIDQANNAKQKSINLEYSMTTRMKAYEDSFKHAFENMGDAMVEFAKTGKFSFKSLIDDLIADLLRFEARAMMMTMYRSFGGVSGVLSSLGFGGTNMQVNAANTMPGDSLQNFFNIIDPVPGKALGAAYEMGIERFSRGGMFSNSIVTEPTLFKFAKGTGMMGEAGPEAIMPLKRDSNGSLGVQGGGSNVEIVVNNYSTAQAETKESVDSRGNRKIEVIIGDMTAGEISRNGSQSQRAMRGTFGLQPQLIRR